MKLLSQIFNETLIATKMTLVGILLILLLPFRIFVWVLYAIAKLVKDTFDKYMG